MLLQHHTTASTKQYMKPPKDALSLRKYEMSKINVIPGWVSSTPFGIPFRLPVQL